MAKKPSIYIIKEYTNHTNYKTPYISNNCTTCMYKDCNKDNDEKCEQCKNEYIVSVWANDYVYKEVSFIVDTEIEANKIVDKYSKEDSIDFFNIYMGISDAIINYVEGFGPQPEFILTNERIKNKNQLNNIINKYTNYWESRNINPNYIKICTNILENLFYNNRIIYTSVPEDSVEIKFFKTREEFNEALHQDNNRMWGRFKRSIEKATSI